MNGAELIAAERQRQIQTEGYTPAHDGAHADESLALAACSYAIPWGWRRYKQAGFVSVPTTWPWSAEHFKPAADLGTAGRVRELVKAGALIAAEIDRLSSSPAEPVRSGVAASSATCKSATEAVTEPETMRRWCVDGCVDPAAPGPGHSDYSAEQVIDWMREMGGEARYEPAPAEHYRDAYEVDRPARIVIAGPSGPVVMHPGDEAVPGEWIAGEPEAGEPARFREFTVRRPSEIECEHGLTEAHETEPDHWCHGPDLPYETVRPASPEGSTG